MKYSQYLLTSQIIIPCLVLQIFVDESLIVFLHFILSSHLGCRVTARFEDLMQVGVEGGQAVIEVAPVNARIVMFSPLTFCCGSLKPSAELHLLPNLCGGVLCQRGWTPSCPLSRRTPGTEQSRPAIWMV